MRRVHRIFRMPMLLACLSLLAGGSGCSSGRVMQDPLFRLEQIRDDGIGIAAVTGLGGGEHPLAGRIEEELQRTLNRERNVVAMLSGELKSTFSEARFEAFLNDFSEIAQVRPEEFELLQSARQHVRFLLLANVGTDRGDKSENLSERIHTKRVKNEATGQYDDIYDYTEYTTTRTATRYVNMRFLVCDLDRRMVVWATTVADDCTVSQSTTTSGWRGRPPSWPSVPGNIEVMDRIVGIAVSRFPK